MKYLFTFLSILLLCSCSKEKTPEVLSLEGVETLNLKIPDSSQTVLDTFAQRALRKGVISKDEKEYVAGLLIRDGQEVQLSIRLKGDWTDHLKTDKISYRIKLSGNDRFLGLKNFSIQHPKTRNYLDEWVLHQIAEMEDVLTTKYEFVNVNINNENKGVYAIEEHFDKQLLERCDRVEGPILKLDDAGNWQNTFMNEKLGFNGAFPYFQSSYVSVFKKNRTLKSETLSRNFEEAKNLLQLFIDGHLALEDIFDIDQLAKYYALAELSGFNHSLRWFNRRFYYNPITQKLEHIMYDVLPFTEYKSDIYMGMKVSANSYAEFVFDNAVILHKEFKERFFFHYDRMSQASYLDSVFQILDPKLSELSQVLEGDNEAYHFNKQQYFEHAEHLKESRIAIESSWNTMMKKRKQPQDWIEDLPYEKRTDKRVMKDVAINAYSSKNGRNEYQLYFENYHLNNVEIVGFVMDSDEPYISLLNELITIGAFETSAKSDSCILQEAVKKVIFRASNNPEQFIQKGVISWSNPRGWSTRMKLATNAKTVSPYFKLEDGKAVIAGRTVIIELLYIPDSLSLVIEAGSQIVFQNGGGLIVSNSVDILGTESKPVHIQCTDSTSQGITILNGDYANINHVFISGLSSLSYDGWGFSSALTIYETSTTFNQISMTNNMAKKDLNLIRCNFKFSSGSFKDSFEGETILDFSFEDSNEQP